jgi:hypothetical protein
MSDPDLEWPPEGNVHKSIVQRWSEHWSRAPWWEKAVLSFVAMALIALAKVLLYRFWLFVLSDT